jgi:hypothetical protein
MSDPDRMSDDGGAIPLGIDARHFTGTGAGIGPAVNVNLPMLGRTVSLTAKALFDIDSHNRFDGNLYLASGRLQVLASLNVGRASN